MFPFLTSAVKNLIPVALVYSGFLSGGAWIFLPSEICQLNLPDIVPYRADTRGEGVIAFESGYDTQILLCGCTAALW